MTTEGQKVVVEDRAALEAIAQAIKLPRKCFVVFSPKEHRIQKISLKKTTLFKQILTNKNCFLLFLLFHLHTFIQKIKKSSL